MGETGESSRSIKRSASMRKQRKTWEIYGNYALAPLGRKDFSQVCLSIKQSCRGTSKDDSRIVVAIVVRALILLNLFPALLLQSRDLSTSIATLKFAQSQSSVPLDKGLEISTAYKEVIARMNQTLPQPNVEKLWFRLTLCLVGKKVKLCSQ